MSRTRRFSLVSIALLAALAGCGGGGDDGTNNPPPPPPPPPPGGTGNGAMAAKINGTTFTSITIGASRQTAGSVTSIAITAIGADLTNSITISTSGITTTGTYPFQLTAPTVLGIVSRAPSSGWDTLGSGASGTLTYSTLTSTHAVGTFSFTAIAQSGTTGPMVVTQGTFDVTFN